MRLVLFDIDGTLLLTGGAGMRALRTALTHDPELFKAFNAVRPDGKTDPLIIREALRLCGREKDCTEELLDKLFTVYINNLKREMSTNKELVVLPGVRSLLDRLAADSRFSIGLATGNIEEGALVKLRHAGLERFFAYGGFGSDAEDRTELIRKAIERGRQTVAPRPVEQSWVIGDTPRDVLHGRAAGAKTMAVASGSYSIDQLRASEPDVLLASLADVENVMRLLAA